MDLEEVQAACIVGPMVISDDKEENANNEKHPCGCSTVIEL